MLIILNYIKSAFISTESVKLHYSFIYHVVKLVCEAHSCEQAVIQTSKIWPEKKDPRATTLTNNTDTRFCWPVRYDPSRRPSWLTLKLWPEGKKYAPPTLLSFFTVLCWAERSLLLLWGAQRPLYIFPRFCAEQSEAAFVGAKRPFYFFIRFCGERSETCFCGERSET